MSAPSAPQSLCSYCARPVPRATDSHHGDPDLIRPDPLTCPPDNPVQLIQFYSPVCRGHIQGARKASLQPFAPTGYFYCDEIFLYLKLHKGGINHIQFGNQGDWDCGCVSHRVVVATFIDIEDGKENSCSQDFCLAGSRSAVYSFLARKRQGKGKGWEQVSGLWVKGVCLCPCVQLVVEWLATTGPMD